MNWINRYLRSCRYEDGARGPVFFDCWGLVRHVLHFELGGSLLPSFGDLRNDNPRGFTKAYIKQSRLMEKCEAEHGAIASVVIGKICDHVAIVIEEDGRLMILEINPGKHARFLPLQDWLKFHNTVTFHRELK